MKPGVTLAVAVVLLSCAPGSPRLDFHPETPTDVRRLAETTFADFLLAFPAQADCVGRVTLATDWEQDDRGNYDPERSLIILRIPGTATKLRNSMLHELGHHLEAACPSHPELRDFFLAAQGFPSDADWFAGDLWEVIPSEQFAEAVVEVVEGRRNLRYGVELSAAALNWVTAWGQGDLRHGRGAP